MELRVLKYFQEVAKEQNITKAAENLSIPLTEVHPVR